MSWIQTHTGKKFDILNIKEEDIDIFDIAHSLSLQCRFNGHCDFFYSTVEHSILVYDIVKEYGHDESLLSALLHDSAETFIGDLCAPFKRLFTFNNYRMIESKIEEVIQKKYKCYFHNLIIKQADIDALYIEYKQLFSNQSIEWNIFNEITPNKYLLEKFPLKFWWPKEAELYFLDIFNELYRSEYIGIK